MENNKTLDTKESVESLVEPDFSVESFMDNTFITINVLSVEETIKLFKMFGIKI